MLSSGKVYSRAVLTYGGMALCLLVLTGFIAQSAWTGSGELHTIMEVSATLIAAFVGIVSLIRYYAARNNEYLFIGTGFLGTSLLDGYHAIVTSSYFHVYFPSSPPSLIPWSWTASRLFLAGTMLLSWWSIEREERLGPSGYFRERTIFIGGGIMLCVTVCLFAFTPLPPAYNPENYLGRPAELIAATLLLCALIGFLRRGDWQHDMSQHWLVQSLVVAFMTQTIVMSRSHQLFDAMFDLAHLLKIASYVCAFVGLSIGMYNLFNQSRQATTQTAAMLEAVPSGLILVNQNGKILSGNHMMHQLFGYEQPELIGQQVEILLPEATQASHPALRRGFFERPELRQMGAGRELSAVKKDGQSLPVEVGLNPVHMAEGLCVLASVVDITERKQHEERLKTSEERLSLSIQGTSDGLWDWNIATGEVWYSERFLQLLGHSADAPMPPVLSSFSDRLHPDDFDQTWNAVNRHLEFKEAYDIEYRLRMKNGRYCWFRARGAATRDEQDKPIRMSGAIQDISDMVAYRRALESSNTELEQFAYVSSHDLQEPLRKVASFCELLEQEYADKLDGDGLFYLKYAVDGAKRMQTLIRDLLLYSSVQSQGEPLQSTDAQAAFDAALLSLDAAITESNVSITHEPLPLIEADLRHLTQLFQNLISNAIKYRTHNAPTVHVGVTEADDEITISVRDNGIGIAPEYQDRIFGIFKRLHTRDEYAGTGIGLAICKRIVERWDGQIRVDSVPEHGSTFSFTARKANSETQYARIDSSTDRHSSGRRRRSGHSAHNKSSEERESL